MRWARLLLKIPENWMTDLVITSFKIEKIQFLSCRPYKYRGGTGVVKTIISQPFIGGLRIVFYIGPACCDRIGDARAKAC